jgi:hypothetical protein
MEKSSFELEQNTNQSPHENEQKEDIEKIKTKLKSLTENVSKCLSESKEFLEIKEEFIKIQPAIENEIKKQIESEENSEYHSSMDKNLEYYFELIDRLNLLTEPSKEMTARLFMASDDVDYAIAHDILRKRELYKSKEKDINQQENLANYILKKFDFSEDEIHKLIQSWLTVKEDESPEYCISQNLKKIRWLEDERKGSAKYLLNNFGIHGFGRYGVPELIKQYDERDNMGPYGLFFQAAMDWNNSFSGSHESAMIGEKVEENSFMMRIIEANGKIDLAKRLLFLRDKYKQKIKFMYMRMHGNTDIVALGEGRDRNSNSLFSKEDLKGKGIQRIKGLFEDNAEVILSSCLTGVEGGLAEEMSNVYNVKVIGADKPTEGHPRSVEVKKNSAGDNLEFNIVFNTADHENEENDKKIKGTVIYKPKD